MAKARKLAAREPGPSIELRTAQALIVRLGKLNQEARALELERDELKAELKTLWQTLEERGELERDAKGRLELWNTAEGWHCMQSTRMGLYPNRDKAEELLSPTVFAEIWQPRVDVVFNIKEKGKRK